LVDNIAEIPDAYKRRLPADVLAMVTASKKLAGNKGRDAAVLVLFSGPSANESRGAAPDSLPDDADLLLIVRAATLRHHAGQAAFPGGASDPGDDGPVATALAVAEALLTMPVAALIASASRTSTTKVRTRAPVSRSMRAPAA